MVGGEERVEESRGSGGEEREGRGWMGVEGS